MTACDRPWASIEWTLPSQDIRATEPFPAAVRQVPDGTPSFPEGELRISFLQETPPPGIVLAHVVAGVGEFELVNAGRSSVTFSGQVRFYNPQFTNGVSASQSFAGTGDEGPVFLAPGERVRVGIVPRPGESVPFRVLNPEVSLTLQRELVAVEVVEGGQVLDALITSAPGATSLFAGRNLEIPPWNGSGVVGLTDRVFRYRRVGFAYTRSATDWEAVREFPGPPPVALTLPLAGIARRLEVSPDRITLAGGAWSGQLTVHEPATSGRLHLDGGAGVTAESPLWTVHPLPRLAWVWSGTNATSEAGPALAAEIRLEEAAPASITIRIAAEASEGLEFPDALEVPAGATRIAFQVSPVDDGLINGTRTARFSASAAGFLPATGITVRVEDSSGVGVTLKAPSRAEVNGFNLTPVEIEILLDRPVDRELRLPLSVTQVFPEDPVPRLPMLRVPEAVFYPGRSNAVVAATATLGAYGFPSRLEIRSGMAGWTNASAVIELVPAVVPRAIPVVQAPLVEGAGEVTNALFITLNALLPTNITLRLHASPGGVVTLPETVVLPAMANQVAVPLVVGDVPGAGGPTGITVECSANGLPAEGVMLRVEDDEFFAVGLDWGASPFDPAFVMSGATNNSILYLFTGPPESLQYSKGGGMFRIELDPGLQDVHYSGPSTITVADGSAPLAFRMDGAGHNLRLRFIASDGQELVTGPFEVRPDRSIPLEPAQLSLSAPASLQWVAGQEAVVALVVSNAGPVLAERVFVTAETALPLQVGGAGTFREEVGPIPPGASRTVSLRIGSREACFGYFTATVGADNPAPEPGFPQTRTEATATTPPFAGGRVAHLNGLQDLAYSAAQGRFYATLANGEDFQVAELDPATATATRRWDLPGRPGLSVTSGDDSQLYVVLNAGTELLRFDLATGTTNLHFVLPSTLQDLAAFPGSASDVLIYRPDAGVQLFRDHRSLGGPLGDHGWLEPDLAGTQVGAFAGNYYLYSVSGNSLRRNGNGGGPFGVVGPASGYRILNGKAYGADGSITTAGGAPAAPYGYSVEAGVDVFPDAPANRIYFAAQKAGLMGTELAVHDLATGRRTGVESVPGVAGRVLRLTRWGSQGLAFATTAGQVYFVESPLVAPEGNRDLSVDLEVLPRADTQRAYTLRGRVVNRGSANAREVRLRLEHPPGDSPDAITPDTPSPRPGAIVWNLGDLAAGESREVTVSLTATSPGTRWVGSFIHGSGNDASPEDTASATIVHVADSPGRPLDLAPLALVYSRARGQFVMSVTTVGGEPRPGLLLLSHEGRPVKWLPLDVPAEGLAVTSDGSAVYANYFGAAELRRTRLSDGVTDVVLRSYSNRAFGAYLVNPERADEVVVSEVRTDLPLFVEVAVYRMGERRSAWSKGTASPLIAGARPDEFFGASWESSPPTYHRFRLTPAGIEWIEALPEHPPAAEIAPDTLIGGFGWVHRDPAGGPHRVLPLGPGVTGVTTIPGLEEVLTLETAPVQMSLKRWNPDLTPRGTRALPERPFEANLAAASPEGIVLVGLRGNEGVAAVRYSEVSAAGLSVAWRGSERSVAPGQILETTLQITNHGPDTAFTLSVPVGLYPAELIEFVPSGGAYLAGTYVLVDSLPPGATAGGILRFRAPYGQLLRLLPSVSTPMFQPQPAVISGDVVFSEPTPAGRFHVFGASVNDLAYDGTRGRLWAALPGLPGRLVALDPAQRRLIEVVSLDFEAVRLVCSADGRFLYAAPGLGPVRRIELDGRTVERLIPLDALAPDATGVFDMAVSPGNAATLAVSRHREGRFLGITVYDDAVPRTQTLLPGGEEQLLYLVNPGNLAFRNPDELATTFGTRLHRLPVTAAGVSDGPSYDVVIWPDRPWFTLMGDRALFHHGRVVRLSDGTEEIALPRGEYLQQSGLPASEVMAGDPDRNRFYAVLTEGTPEGGRYLRGLGLPGGDPLWTITTTTGGAAPRMLMAGPETLALVTSGNLWLLPLDEVSTPSAPLSLAGAWTGPFLPAETAGFLTLSVANPGPWDAGNVVLHLPSDAAAFSEITVEPSWLEAIIEPGRIRFPKFGALTTATLRLRWTGRSQTGDYAPTFSLTAHAPATVSPPSAISPRVRVVALPEISVSSITVVEGDSGNQQVRIPVRLSEPARELVNVVVALEPVTAESPGDYSSFPGGTSLLIPAGRAESAVVINVRGDLVPEGVETLRCRLQSARGARIGSSDTATVTIVDNDGPDLTVGNLISIPEGNSGVSWITVPVELSFAPLSETRVEYLTDAETASSGSDFIPTRGALVFAAGQTQAAVRLGVLGDQTPEADETLRLLFYGGADLKAASDRVRIQVLNDDGASELRIGAPLMTEPGLGIAVDSRAGSFYQLERADTLDGPWGPVGSPVAGTGQVLILADPQPPEFLVFYRVLQTP